MCGIFYSNRFTQDQRQVHGIRRRGPEGFQTLRDGSEFWAHAMLDTVGTPTPQPSRTHHGVLLYNGDTYNHLGTSHTSDTQWIADGLGGDHPRVVEVIRGLRGQYAICYSTDTHVIWATDQFATKSLFYYYDATDRVIAVCSHANELKRLYGAAWPCAENRVYVLDRSSFAITAVTTTRWDFDQTVDNLDGVFNDFEAAVRMRWREDALLLLSSGLDAGAIACALEKQGIDFLSIADTEHEDNDVIRARMARHNTAVNRAEPLSRQEHQDLYEIGHNPRMKATPDNNRKMRGFCEYADAHDCKILIEGNGADEIYADYGFGGTKYRSRSKFGGVFHQDLSLLWPWHNSMDSLATIVSRNDQLYGYYGKENRLPFLDQKLVQSWLNTTLRLKNKEYKHWIVEYLKRHDYPCHKDKIGLSGRLWN